MKSERMNEVLFYSRISVPATLAGVSAFAVFVTLRYIFADATPVGDDVALVHRLMNNVFCVLIASVFSGGLMFALLQFIGLRGDSGSSANSVSRFLSGRSSYVGPQDLGHEMTGERVLDLLTLQRQREFLPIQYVIWVLPMMGFIGTVWGISQSIGGLTGLVSGQTSAGKDIELVLSGLQFAFDTTLLGLVGAVPLMLLLAGLRSRAIQLDSAFVAELWKGR